MAGHKIILASVASGSEGAVTTALAQVLGLPEESVKPLVASVPIILMDDLEPDQAQTIATAMAAAKQAGGNLVISGAPAQNMRSVNWPAPPKVGGRDIASFKGGAPPSRAGSGVGQAVGPGAAPPSAPPYTAAPSAAVMACPHCGKPIALHAARAGPSSSSSSIRQVPVAQALGGAGGAEDADNIGKVLPEVPDVRGRVETPPPPADVRTTPMELEEFERGVGGGAPLQKPSDTLLKQLDKALEEPEPKSKKPPSPLSGQPGRTRPRSPRGASERTRGRDRKRRR